MLAKKKVLVLDEATASIGKTRCILIIPSEIAD
jgi:ABC-type multidrug transport system fused ATPase/permease subunit